MNEETLNLIRGLFLTVLGGTCLYSVWKYFQTEEKATEAQQQLATALMAMSKNAPK